MTEPRLNLARAWRLACDTMVPLAASAPVPTSYAPIMTELSHQLLVRADTAGFARVSSGLGQELGYSGEELGVRPLLDWLHPDDSASVAALLQAGEGSIDARHSTRSGQWLPLTFTVRAKDDLLHVIGQPAPLDSATPAERDSVASQGSLMSQMLRRMALIVEGKNPGNRCSILLVNAEGNCVTVGAGPSLPEEYNSAVEGLIIGPSVGSCGTAAYWNVPVIVENIQEDPLWKGLRDVAALADVRACWSQPIRGSFGEVLGALALYSNVPEAPDQTQMDCLEIAARMVGIAVERERLEFQLRQTAKFEALGVLAGGVAHDFNNLLAVVIGNVDLAIATGAVNDAGREMLGDIISASESATSICNQMLTYAGRGNVTTETIDSGPVIRELSKLLQIVLSKKASLHLDLTEDLRVRGDCTQLRQVLMNLITNGAEAIGNHPGEVTVTTRPVKLSRDSIKQRALCPSVTPGEYVEFAVSDTGCGMDAETQAKIFDPFFSTKADGRGLGLAAVMGIVKAHGWALQVNSVAGQGTTCRLLLPRGKEPVAEHRELDSPQPPAKTRVLLVDDESGVLKAVTRILEHAGMEVRCASDGAEAVSVYAKHHHSIDCVVLDLNMPVLDGEEVFQEMKAVCNDVRVVLVSGYAEQSVLERFRGAGLSGVLQKPMRASDLLQKIAEAVAPPTIGV